MADIAAHDVPVIDRMMDILGALEQRGTGLTISELTQASTLPRTTIYRILNTLQRHEMVRRDTGGAYHLGRRLLSLAAHVASQASEINLAAICQPHLDRLALDLGESVKVSVLSQEGILVLAAATGRREYALSVAPGQHMPIHAGAASKLLLAAMDAPALNLWLSRPLTAYTAKTIVDPKRLHAEVARIRRQGWAQDNGENAPGVQAFAAPILSRSGEMVAALSIPFLAGTDAARMEDIRLATIAAAHAISSEMPA